MKSFVKSLRNSVTSFKSRLGEARRLLADLNLWWITSIPGKTGIRIRRLHYLRRGFDLAENVRLFEGVKITGGGNCVIEDGVTLFSGTVISLGKEGKFRIGKNSHCGAQCYFLVGNGRIDIGNGTAIGPATILLAHTNVGDSNCPVIDNVRSGTILVEDDVLIGAGVIIRPDVTISAHSVIGAGSVVTRSNEEWSISAGSPARAIGLRSRGNKG